MKYATVSVEFIDHALDNDNSVSYPALRHKEMSIGTKKEQIMPFKTDSTTVSSFVYFNMTGSVVSSLVAPAGAIQVK